MKQYVFVAGYDYEGKGVTFKYIANHRMKQVISANAAKDELRFHICDFKTGEINKHVVTYPSGTKTTTVSQTASFDAITSSHYGSVLDVNGDTQTGFKDNQRTVMSILNIYEQVQKIGLDDPGTLIELSFFSHGWMGGPILVNSFDNRSQEVVTTNPDGTTSSRIITIGGTTRDPDDMDPRGQYDFTAPTMDAIRLTSFQDAFHADGYVWIWGCAFPTLIHKVLTKIEKNSAYKRSGVTDSTIFSFTNLTTEEKDVLSFFSNGNFTPPATGQVDITFEMIKYIMCIANINTYASAMARAANKKVYAAPLGTYSEFDQTGTRPLMNVSSKFTRHFNFYSTYLGYAFDPENRRYAEYLPTTICTAPAPPTPVTPVTPASP